MSTQQEPQQKCWMATINNPTEDEKQFILSLEAEEVVADEEVGEEGTPHIHAYIHFQARKRLSALKHLLPRAHWDPVHSMVDSRNYCLKGHVIRNDQSMTSKRGSQSRLLTRIAIEKGLKAAYEEDPYLFHRNYKLLVQAWSYAPPQLEYWKPTVVWIYGDTGVGKTRWVFESEKGNLSILLCKPPLWFDSYKQWNEAVLFDDFRADTCELHVLLQILDRYPIDVPIKGGHTAWRPKRIYITSCFPPEGVYRNVSEENMAQLRRRIDRCIHMVSFNAPTATFSLSSDAVFAFSPNNELVPVGGNNATPERFPLPSGIPLLPETHVQLSQ